MNDRIVLPKIKNTVEHFKVNSSVVLKQGEDAYEVEDKSGVLYELCQRLNGKNSRLDIENTLAKKFNQPARDIRDIINQLDELRLLENDAFNQSKEDYLDSTSLERWSRNFDFFGSFCQLKDNKYQFQHHLKNLKVGLLGLGGLGSQILYNLTALGVENIKAADFDNIELSNLNRQILYKQDDVGKNKSATAAKRIKEFNHNLNIDFQCMKFESAEDIESIIYDRDIVICVADKPRMKIALWLNEACVKQGIPFISGGLNVNRGVIYSVIPGESGCTACWRNSANIGNDLEKAIYQQNLGKYTEFETPFSAPAIVPLVAMVTGAMVSELIKISTNLTQPSFTNKFTQIDFQSISSKVLEKWERKDDCTVCGKRQVSDIRHAG